MKLTDLLAIHQVPHTPKAILLGRMKITVSKLQEEYYLWTYLSDYSKAFRVAVETLGFPIKKGKDWIGTSGLDAYDVLTVVKETQWQLNAH